MAGVSQSTVSRVFSDVISVKPELKERVYRAAEEIGYRPNLVARGMISGKTSVIGLVVGDRLGPFDNRLINKFAEAIQ
ncbi:LacI family DNA-binding transcriptional regulator, partial [Erysipelatoclostridium ramosum]|nr:LacI family DNA-binding transcriptional regulator [Thomasclavelia ramosa]